MQLLYVANNYPTHYLISFALCSVPCHAVVEIVESLALVLLLVARQVLENCIAYWGMAVANLVSLFNPEKIIFGGGVFGPAAQFLNRIKEEALQWAQPISVKQVTLEVSSLGGDAGLIGAAQLALRALQI